ncbi:MAG: hypothetical protein JKY70_19480, partial [Mucilaginibacter sp.]|nr:hypothetical protein [Mucilaginibacter sp.]
MKKVFIVIAAFAIITSCKKQSHEVAVPDKEAILPQDINVTVKGTNEVNSPLYPASENYNYLGFGYDVTDKFNNEASVRASVVDVTAYGASNADRIAIIGSTQGGWNTIEAENAEDLSERFSDSFEPTKGLKLFGNTLRNAFPGTVANAKKYVYGYYSEYFIQRSY